VTGVGVKPAKVKLGPTNPRGRADSREPYPMRDVDALVRTCGPERLRVANARVGRGDPGPVRVRQSSVVKARRNALAKTITPRYTMIMAVLVGHQPARRKPDNLDVPAASRSAVDTPKLWRYRPVVASGLTSTQGLRRMWQGTALDKIGLF